MAKKRERNLMKKLTEESEHTEANLYEFIQLFFCAHCSICQLLPLLNFQSLFLPPSTYICVCVCVCFGWVGS